MMDCNYPASGQHFAIRESKESPLKRKRTDSELQTNENRVRKRRTEAGEKDVKTGKTEACVEASCSVSKNESKENALKRKRTDLAHEKPELQHNEHQAKKRRTVREEKEEKTETCVDSCSVPKREHGVPCDGQRARRRRRKKRSRRTKTEKKDSFFVRYILGKLLGTGGFGSVYAGIRKSDGKKVALKFMGRDASEYITLPGDARRLPLEVALMKLVCKPPHCPHVIQMLDWIETPTLLILVLERPDPCIDLFDYCGDKSISESKAKIILQQVIHAARHCQERGVFHRDIKEENILLNPQSLKVKLIDFGCGDLLRDAPYTIFAGTPNFQPPETFIKYEYEAEPTTVWGLGIIMYRMLCGAEPFDGAKEIVDGHLNVPDYLSEASCSLIRWCLHPDPKSRPTLEQMLTHPWFWGSCLDQ